MAATPRDAGPRGQGWAGTLGIILAICQVCGLGRLCVAALGPAGAWDGGDEIIPAPPLPEGRVVVTGRERRESRVLTMSCALALWRLEMARLLPLLLRTRAAWLPCRL